MYVFDRVTTGYRKAQKGLACEDAVLTEKFDDYVVMACADGHGDRKCKYAAKGAALAVWTMNKVLKGMRKAGDKLQDFGKALNDGREDIVKRFVCSWVRAVLDDYKVSHPEDVGFQSKYKELFGYAKKIYEIRNGEMPIRDFKALAEYRHNCEEEIYKITLLYGTTVNAVVVTEKFVFALGIGDGDIIAVNGKRVEWLLPPAPQFNTSPASMCGNFGVIPDNFAAVYIPVTKGSKLTDTRFLPEIITISTDGLRNAFTSDETFAEKLIEIAGAFKDGKGWVFVKNSKQWIAERSEYGTTQDDIAFCLCTKYSLKNTRSAKTVKAKTVKKSKKDA